MALLSVFAPVLTFIQFNIKKITKSLHFYHFCKTIFVSHHIVFVDSWPNNYFQKTDFLAHNFLKNFHSLFSNFYEVC